MRELSSLDNATCSDDVASYSSCSCRSNSVFLSAVNGGGSFLLNPLLSRQTFRLVELLPIFEGPEILHEACHITHV